MRVSLSGDGLKRICPSPANEITRLFGRVNIAWVSPTGGHGDDLKTLENVCVKRALEKFVACA